MKFLTRLLALARTARKRLLAQWGLTAAMTLQYVWGEIPCPLCLLQRVALFGIAFGIVLLTLASVAGGWVGMSWFPEAEADNVVALLTFPLCALAVWISMMVRLGVVWTAMRPPVFIFLAFELVLFLAVFLLAGVYNNVFRFHGPKGLAQIARCCAIIAVVSSRNHVNKSLTPIEQIPMVNL